MVTDWTFAAFASMVLGFFSIGLMFLLHQKQKEQAIELQNMTTSQMELINDTRDVYASSIVDYIQRISDSYGHVIDLYFNKYPIGKITANKKDIQNTLNSYYDRHLFNLPPIESMEIVKVFGKKIANQHWRLTAKLTSNMWQTYSDYGMALMMHSYKEEMNNLVQLKDIFLPFCDDEMKERDKKFKENYDLIKKELKNAETPKKEDYENSF